METASIELASSPLPDKSLPVEEISSLSLNQSVIDFLSIGGPVVWILAALSVLSLSIIILKLWQFSQARLESDSGLQISLDNWEKGYSEQALNVLNVRYPIQSLVKNAMLGLLNAHDRAVLERELSRQANYIHHQSKLYLKPLEVIASLSPLLGLMGTVLGMIEAFQQMQAAGSRVDPSILSGGIWQALLTTAAGLAVAIPVAAIHSWFERKSERIAHLMNDSVARVFSSSLLVDVQTNKQLAEKSDLESVEQHAA